MQVSFTIPGRIRGKGRPRFSRAAGVIHTYTDEKTASSEAMVKTIAALAMRGRSILQGPLGLKILVFQRPAESWSKKRKAAAKWIVGKPDCDNQIKLLCDSMNGIVWADDAQVAQISFERRYSMIDPEYVAVTAYEL